MDVASYDLLSTVVLLLNDQGRVENANAAAEDLFSVSRKQLAGQLVDALFDEDAALAERLPDAINGKFGILRQDLTIDRWGDQVSVSLDIVPLHRQPWAALLEVRVIAHKLLLDRPPTLSNELPAHSESLRQLAPEGK